MTHKSSCSYCTATIQTPELLHLSGGFTQTSGANQTWYGTHWQRQAGCGPTVCSHLLYYLSRTRPECEQLCPYNASHQTGFVRLMEEVWQYVTPGRMGVNTTTIFSDGALQFGQERGITLESRVLEVPVLPLNRPSWEEASSFLCDAFEDNLLVGFLNLSNGSLRNLESWHWVTLVAVNPQEGTAVMYDQGRRREIQLDLWLKTTTLGGGFVVLEPQKS